MLNWSLLKSPVNWIVITLMVLIALLAFDRAATFYRTKFPSAPVQPPAA